MAPSPPSVRARVALMSSILARSSSDRTRVITAIDGVQNCTIAPSQGQSTVETVIADRKATVGQLQQIDTRGLPAGTSLISELTTTLNAAISDDVSYMSWMADIANGHATCGGNPMSDPNFAAAQAQSNRTNDDKSAFVQIWDQLARTYGQPTYGTGDF